MGEREVIFREGEIRFILLVDRKRGRRFRTENKEQVVQSSTDRTAAFNSEIHLLARFTRCILAGCGRTVHRNRGTAGHEFQECFAEGRGRTAAFIAGTFPLVCCTFLSDFSQYFLA